MQRFFHAGAIVVPRSRFAPVKTCNDLFVLRSDAYEVGIMANDRLSCQGRVRIVCASQCCERACAAGLTTLCSSAV